MSKVRSYTLSFGALVLTATTALAQDPRPAISEMDLVPEDGYLIDAQCSAVFRLMSDIGQQRGSELAPTYDRAASIMAEIATKKHATDFNMGEDMALQLVQSKAVLEHESYVLGLQSQDTDFAAAELGRFGKDVQFCNQRLRTYDAFSQKE